MEKKKRGYFVYEKDGDYGFPVVATSEREARKIAWQRCDLWCDWIDIRATWKRDANVEDLPIGYVEDEILGLRRGMFDYLEDTKCEVCGEFVRVEYHEGKVICSDCLDEKIRKD